MNFFLRNTRYSKLSYGESLKFILLGLESVPGRDRQTDSWAELP